MNELEEKQELTLPKQKKKFRLGKKGRVAVVLLALVILAAAVLPRLGGGAGVTQVGYTVEQAARRDLSVSVSGSATLVPADSYQVNTLISGAILSAPFEEDDLVEQGALLYELDSGDARNSVSRAGLSVEQAQLSYDQAKEAQHPTAPINVTIIYCCPDVKTITNQTTSVGIIGENDKYEKQPPTLGVRGTHRKSLYGAAADPGTE